MTIINKERKPAQKKGGPQSKDKNSSGGNNKRDLKQQRKKGAPKWKNVEVEVENIKKRLEKEVPPSGVLYYKYKPAAGNEAEALAEEQTTSKTIANRKILETSDKSLIKIRFADLPLSKATMSGLFKAKFLKLTEV